MDTLCLKELASSDYNYEHKQPEDKILRETFSIDESVKNDSGIESLHTGVSQERTHESSSVYESPNATNNVTESNQLNLYKELSSDVWNEIFPCHKQPASNEFNPNLSKSQQKVSISKENLESCPTDNHNMMKTCISKEWLTFLSYESLVATGSNQPNPYEQINSDIWNEILSPCKQLSSTKL